MNSYKMRKCKSNEEVWHTKHPRTEMFTIEKPKVWAGSPNECRTFGRTSAECCARMKQRLLLVVSAHSGQNNIVVSKHASSEMAN